MLTGQALGAAIEEARKLRGVSKVEMARDFGVKPPSIQDWVRRGTIDKEKLPALWAYFAGVVGPAHWGLAAWPSVITTGPIPVGMSGNPEFPTIRRVNFKLSAGVSGFAIDHAEDDGAPIVFRRDWFDTHGYRPERMLACRVNGSSMEPTLYDSDLVVINTAQCTPRDGHVFAINYAGELAIKRMAFDAGAWLIKSDNPDKVRYPDKHTYDAVSLIGEVVYRQSERL